MPLTPRQAAVAFALRHLDEGCRPGERLLHGKPLIFDMDLLNDWRAMETARTAPANLWSLSDETLDGLFYAGIRLDQMSDSRDPTGVALINRADAERRRRASHALRAQLAASVAILTGEAA